MKSGLPKAKPVHSALPIPQTHSRPPAPALPAAPLKTQVQVASVGQQVCSRPPRSSAAGSEAGGSTQPPGPPPEPRRSQQQQQLLCRAGSDGSPPALLRLRQEEKMSLMLCRWEQKNVTMKLGPGLHTSTPQRAARSGPLGLAAGQGWVGPPERPGAPHTLLLGGREQAEAPVAAAMERRQMLACVWPLLLQHGFKTTSSGYAWSCLSSSRAAGGVEGKRDRPSGHGSRPQKLADRSHIMSKGGGLKASVRSFSCFSCSSYKVVRLWWC
ncbi:unnamed protein product [Tetraodon nigroviridis]|uniref:(spotted green pufferfish) hypothetical protein n=1 Tax=Tetraodon nigroviridis TaxID=99883 RepID=Q4SHA9_TETNG|nr:unnamed protein product [Tetraodon nigroviridis]